MAKIGETSEFTSGSSLLVIDVTDISHQSVKPVGFQERRAYQADVRPLCQGMPFVLTDSAHPRLVLKHGSHFLVLDQSALVPSCNSLGYGYYRYDTRHLSQWEIYLDDIPLSLLSSDVKKGYGGTFLYTNPQTAHIAQQKVTIERQLILQDVLWERLSISNYDNKPLDLQLTIKFQSDFADMFEVRGLNRPQRGTRMLPFVDESGHKLYLAYQGVDGLLMETIIEFFGIVPVSMEDGVVILNVHAPIREARSFEISVSTRWEGQEFTPYAHCTSFHDALKQSEDQYREWCGQSASIGTNHDLFDLALERSFRDIYILRQPSPKGLGLGAGIPWYAAIFGRDSAIAALQTLPFMPQLARQCIEVLAAYQGQKTDLFRAERPGKILHELRLGELARTGVVPHSPYFGTVDATQLWLMLFGKYIDWTGDLQFAHELWPNVKLSMKWLEEEESETGFVRYRRESEHGLENQGWKDSGDSVMHKDGVLAKPPIALCEPQAYLYAARLEVGKVAKLLGHHSYAEKLLEQAETLKERFYKHFWMDNEEYIALALDGDGKQVQVITSNPGHCIWCGILDNDAANKVADKIMTSRLHSGWGIRTLSSGEVAFNPISYHNGSVWPHDNAIIIEGIQKLGRTRDAHLLILEMLEVAQLQPEFRLPELFCGFIREASNKPIDYPVSCSPQAWAAGSLFQVLACCLSFEPEAINNILKINNPSLPSWLGKIEVRNLKVGESKLDLAFNGEGEYTFLQILKKTGKVRVIVET
ncbi:MAG TPA: amylo-alpha-1,6-glucosidase [Candidatus Obscuribacterales bacterium]